MGNRPPQPANDDGIKTQVRRHLSWSQVRAALATLGVLVVLMWACVFWLPERLYRPL
jgi:hypothetical protein